MKIRNKGFLQLVVAVFLGAATPNSARADNIVFDPDGPGMSPAINVDYFQFGAGNSLAEGLIPFTAGRPFQLLFQAQLNSIVTFDGTQVTPTGLNASTPVGAVTPYEVTIVGSVTENVTGVNAGPPLRAVFQLASNQAANSFVEIYFDGAQNANPLQGTGYNDGTLILRGTPATTIPDTGTFAQANPQPTPPPNFDSFGANDYLTGGTGAANLTSILGAGATKFNVIITFIDPAFFVGQVHIGDILTLDISQVAPFTGVNPSRRFAGEPNTPSTNTGPGPSPSATPSLGSNNGVSGPDLQTQSLIGGSITAGATPTPTPTPGPSTTPTPTPTVTPSVTPTATPVQTGPKVIVQASRTQLREGADSTITFSTNEPVHPDITVFYSVGGTATLNVDYALSGTPGQVVIPANQSSASILLHSIPDSVSEPNGEAAKIILQPHSGYQVPANNDANRVVILILDRT